MKEPETRRRSWTVARRNHFLDALRGGASIAVAARAAGMSRESAHRLRARAGSDAFAAAWDAAQAEARRRESETHVTFLRHYTAAMAAMRVCIAKTLAKNPGMTVDAFAGLPPKPCVTSKGAKRHPRATAKREPRVTLAGRDEAENTMRGREPGVTSDDAALPPNFSTFGITPA